MTFQIHLAPAHHDWQSAVGTYGGDAQGCVLDAEAGVYGEEDGCAGDGEEGGEENEEEAVVDVVGEVGD